MPIREEALSYSKREMGVESWNSKPDGLACLVLGPHALLSILGSKLRAAVILAFHLLGQEAHLSTGQVGILSCLPTFSRLQFPGQ